jgi:GTP pyrophosphokinase
MLHKVQKDLLEVCQAEYGVAGLKLIRRSIDFFNEVVQGDRHADALLKESVDLGKMAVRELGLDPMGVSVSMLMPLSGRSDGLAEKAQIINKRVAGIVGELERIQALNTRTSDQQSENMRNLILSLSSDFRVILIKIAERLYRMRHMSQLSEPDRIVLASEARAIYSPLAHRLGLYNMMSEMDDIAMSILEKQAYAEISKKLSASKGRRQKFISDFIAPIQAELEKNRLRCEIFGRPKSISSIWRKMKRQQVAFEEVYDRFAIRVILDSSPGKEKAHCWQAYSIITDIYQPNPDRLRDWISVPKSNGYESLHTTVVVPGGDWVEVQIRSQRMNEIAEKGLAAHWKYKGIKGQAGIDEWLARVREALEKADDETSAGLIDDLKLRHYSREIFVFTPDGDLKKFPEDATVLDFAYDIHTAVGSSCTGAKINGKIVPIRHKLKNGDKVEIIRSKTQKAKVDWLSFVTTSKAKNKIRQALKEEKLKEADHGKEILKRRFKNWKIEYNDASIRKIIQFFKYKDSIDLHYDIASEKIDLLSIKEILTTEEHRTTESKGTPIEGQAVDRILTSAIQQSNDYLVIDDKIANIDYKLAKCCTPIHGDEVFGFVTRTSGISIHRINCPNAHQLMSRYGYRVVKAQWTKAGEDTRFSVSIMITGLDDIGIVSNISDVISKDLQVNMRSISIDSNDGMFEGTITLFVKDAQHLEALIRKLKKVKGVSGVRRIDH